MRSVPERAVISVVRREGVWNAEFEGLAFGHSPEREVARAAAHRRARELQDGGTACQVRVSGEHGFFGV